MYGTNLRDELNREASPPALQVPGFLGFQCPQWGRDAYWRTPELDVGGAWQGWDTKCTGCTAELLAWHWLAVKLRFAGGNQRDGRDGQSRLLGLNDATSLYGTLGLYTQRITYADPRVSVPNSSLVLFILLACWSPFVGCRRMPGMAWVQVAVQRFVSSIPLQIPY